MAAVKKTVKAATVQAEAVKKPRKAKAKMPPVANAKEQADAVARIGARLREARELNGWELNDAAPRLGYTSAGSLSKIESARHISAIPMWLIPRACEVYGVSADYLHGLSDDLELTPGMNMRRDVGVWLFNELNRIRQRDLEAFIVLQDRIEMVATGAQEVIAQVEEFHQALGTFRAQNVARFDNMRGGSTVMYRADQALGKALQLSGQLTKFKNMVRVSAASGKTDTEKAQMPLDLLAVTGE